MSSGLNEVSLIWQSRPPSHIRISTLTASRIGLEANYLANRYARLKARTQMQKVPVPEAE